MTWLLVIARWADIWASVLLAPADDNAAMRLVAHELSTDCNGMDFAGTVRAGALGKLLSEQLFQGVLTT